MDNVPKRDNLSQTHLQLHGSLPRGEERMKPHPKGQPGGPGLKKSGGGYRTYPNNKPTFSQISNLFASFDQNYLVQETAVKRNPILLLRVTQRGNI